MVKIKNTSKHPTRFLRDYVLAAFESEEREDAYDFKFNFRGTANKSQCSGHAYPWRSPRYIVITIPDKLDRYDLAQVICHEIRHCGKGYSTIKHSKFPGYLMPHRKGNIDYEYWFPWVKEIPYQTMQEGLDALAIVTEKFLKKHNAL